MSLTRVQRLYIYGILLTLALAGSICWLAAPTRLPVKSPANNLAQFQVPTLPSAEQTRPASSGSSLNVKEKAAPMKEKPLLTARLRSEYNRLPLSFEKNEGQVDSEVKFISRGKGYSLYLSPTESLLSLHASRERTAALRMQMVGANPDAPVVGDEVTENKINYFIGNDASKWRTNIASFAKVRYQGVYQGIDMVYYGNQQQLEYDFVVAPGANPDLVRLRMEGAKQLKINKDGDLVVKVAGGEVVQQRPVIYQEQNGAREIVDGRYVIKGKNQVGFEIADYDESRTLVIDPTLVYSTYFGGSDFEFSGSVAVDSTGNAYLTGGTGSFDFPTKNPLQSALSNPGDVFIAKFNSGGSLLFSTYLGGFEDDFGADITLDDNGNIYVTGTTGNGGSRASRGKASRNASRNGQAHTGLDGIEPQSSNNNFPVTANAFQTAPTGFATDAFISKLNPAGSQLLYSSYLGGDSDDSSNAISVAAPDDVYIAGFTSASNFPVSPGAFQTTIPSFPSGFVARFNTGAAGAASRIYATFLGGSNFNVCTGIAADGNGNVYVTGNTNSFDFPLQNAFQTSPNLGSGSFATDAFITKLTPDGGNLLFSSYYGGSDAESARDLLLTGNSLYLVGDTFSFDLPGTSLPRIAPQAAQGSNDGFITKFTVGLTSVSINVANYYGGSGNDSIASVAVDSIGNVYFAGGTDSFDLPVIGASQSFFAGSRDAFVARMNAANTSLLYSTYLGGSDSDEAYGIGVDAASNAYVFGDTFSFDFSIKNAFQSLQSGNGDTFLTKLNNVAPAPRLSVSPGTLTFVQAVGGSSSQTVTIRNTGTAQLCITDLFLASGGRKGGDYTLQTDCFFGDGTVCLAPQQTCTITVTFTPTVAGPNNDSIIISTDNAGTASVSLIGNPQAGTLNGTVQFSSANYTVGEGSTASITVTRVGGDRGQVSVSYLVNNGSAQINDDFLPSGGTIVFNDGDANPKTFNIQTVDDNKVEGAESINLLLTNLSGGAVLGLGSANLTIIDNDVSQPGRIQFSQNAYSVNEDAGFASITVTRSGGSNVPVSAVFTAGNGSASAGSDFDAISTTVNFGIGVTSQTVSVPIFNDKDDEPDETVILTLSGVAGGAVLGGPSVATLTISDDDIPIQPGILQADAEVMFGSVNIGQSTKRTIALRNVGGLPLTFSMPVITNGDGYSISIPPSQFTLSPNQSTTFEVTLQPQPGSLGIANGLITITSDSGGAATVVLKGQSIDTVPPSVTLTSPNGGEALVAGAVFRIRFKGVDNDAVSSYVVSFSAGGSNGRGGDIARVDGKTTEVVWAVPTDLQTATGRIIISARDRAGNVAPVTSGQFSVTMPQSDAPLLQTRVTFVPPPTGSTGPPTNAMADAREIRGASLPPAPAPVLKVNISFDPPPAGQIAPPQNVKVSAGELGTSALPEAKISAAMLTKMLMNSVSNQQAPQLLGYNVYRVAEPEDGQLPTPEMIVDPKNLVATLDATSTGFTDTVSTSESPNYTYSITSFFGNGMMSSGSAPAGTDLPVIKNPSFRLGTLFIDAAGSFIKSGAQLIVDDNNIYPLQFDDSGTLFTVPKKTTSTSGLTVKKLIKKGDTVRLIVKNPDGKISVGVMFTRGKASKQVIANNLMAVYQQAISGQSVINKNVGVDGITPKVDDTVLLGFNVYRIAEPVPGQPMPTPAQIIQPDNLVGSISANQTVFTDTVSSSQSPTGNFVYSITSFFGNGMMSTGSAPAGTDLPVIKNLQFTNKAFLLDAAGSFIQTGATLIINDTEMFKVQFDDSGTRFTVLKDTKSDPSGLVLDKVLVKGTAVRVSIKNPDGKESVGVTFTR